MMVPPHRDIRIHDLARINEDIRAAGYERGYDEGLAAAEAEARRVPVSRSPTWRR